MQPAQKDGRVEQTGSRIIHPMRRDVPAQHGSRSSPLSRRGLAASLPPDPPRVPLRDDHPAPPLSTPRAPRRLPRPPAPLPTPANLHNPIPQSRLGVDFPATLPR